MAKSARILLIGGVGLFALLPFARFALVARIESELVPRRFREVVADPGADFTKLTGLPWPGAARVVLVGDDHGGFHGDGEFYLVFDVDRETIGGWLSGRPPWNAEAWRSGPVPSDVAGHCWFGGGPGSRANDGVFKDEKMRYVATSRGPASMPWHNGNLIVIDAKHSRILLSSWDF